MQQVEAIPASAVLATGHTDDGKTVFVQFQLPDGPVALSFTHDVGVHLLVELAAVLGQAAVTRGADKLPGTGTKTATMLIGVRAEFRTGPVPGSDEVALAFVTRDGFPLTLAIPRAVVMSLSTQLARLAAAGKS